MEAVAGGSGDGDCMVVSGATCCGGGWCCSGTGEVLGGEWMDVALSFSCSAATSNCSCKFCLRSVSTSACSGSSLLMGCMGEVELLHCAAAAEWLWPLLECC